MTTYTSSSTKGKPRSSVKDGRPVNARASPNTPPAGIKPFSKPLNLNSIAATYTKQDDYDRYLFSISEEQFDELIERSTVLQFTGEHFPIFYDDFTDLYTIRGKFYGDGEHELIGGAIYNLSMIVKASMMYTDRENKKGPKECVAYIKFRSATLLSMPAEEENEEEEKPVVKSKSSKSSKHTKKPTAKKIHGRKLEVVHKPDRKVTPPPAALDTSVEDEDMNSSPATSTSSDDSE